MMLVLASASASRARMLQAAGVEFEVQPANVDEDAVKEALLAERASPAEIAQTLAERKALHVSRSRPATLVLGADQVLDFEGKLLSKCGSLGEARELLKRLRGTTHRLISAAVLAQDGAIVWRHTGHARLAMRAFSEGFLDAYLSGEGMALLSGVGCYRLEGSGVQLFEAVEGDYFSILGLPLVPLLAELRTRGVLPT